MKNILILISILFAFGLHAQDRSEYSSRLFNAVSKQKRELTITQDQIDKKMFWELVKETVQDMVHIEQTLHPCTVLRTIKSNQYGDAYCFLFRDSDDNNGELHALSHPIWIQIDERNYLDRISKKIVLRITIEFTRSWN